MPLRVDQRLPLSVLSGLPSAPFQYRGEGRG